MSRLTIGASANIKCENRARRGESPILPIRSSPVTPTVLTVFGTRPEAIKLAPLIRGIEASDSLRSRTLVTAQHREMLDQVNNRFGIVPDFDLNIMAAGQTLNGIASRVIGELDAVLAEAAPDAEIGRASWRERVEYEGGDGEVKERQRVSTV